MRVFLAQIQAKGRRWPGTVGRAVGASAAAGLPRAVDFVTVWSCPVNRSQQQPCDVERSIGSIPETEKLCPELIPFSSWG